MSKDKFINVSINSKEINNLLNKITQKTTNLRRIMSPIGNYIAKSVRQNFNEQGRPDKWQSLSPYSLLSLIFLRISFISSCQGVDGIILFILSDSKCFLTNVSVTLSLAIEDLNSRYIPAKYTF